MNTYNLFISHAWKYNNGYYKVVDWLDSAVANKEFNYKNYSVPQHDPIIDPDTNVGKNQLKRIIKNSNSTRICRYYSVWNVHRLQ